MLDLNFRLSHFSPLAMGNGQGAGIETVKSLPTFLTGLELDTVLLDNVNLGPIL